ncbi:type II-A CRISPR-associated protein Csn2 [Microaceticoccus formicicus]|uniref:type II-A CRISPR-associated protein Csn2 n=1 Tax=Microaceticoccus formicicus TaxID=3118105 RepID=UPI003CD018F5|nr:type II-A CRISPR-associated protein Csn2 [Peptoniphilaceae bacterium AMB_02]
MILTHREWNFNIEIEGLNTIIIENPKLYRRILMDIDNQLSGLEGGFTLINELKEVKISSELYLVRSPFLISINDKKIINKLYAELKGDVISSEFDRFQELERSILSFVNEIIFNNSIGLEVDCSIEIEDIFKLTGVKFCEDTGKDIIERLLEHALIVQDYLMPSAIVYLNTRSLFSDIEWCDFTKELSVRNINAIFIERYGGAVSKLIEKRYTIDEDLCEIY